MEQVEFGVHGTYFGYGSEAHSIAMQYSDSKEKQILTATVSKDFKSITSKDLDSKRTEYRKQAYQREDEIYKINPKQSKDYYEKMHAIMRDDGTFAAALGYDGIIIENPKIKDTGYLNILNRKKVYLSE